MSRVGIPGAGSYIEFVRSPGNAVTLDYRDYEHPRSIAEVQSIVRNARAAGAQVRVRGSMHSEQGSVLGDGFSRDGRRRPVVHVMLDRLTDIYDGAPGNVVVEAGVSMGGDVHAPGDGNPQRDRDLSLFRWLSNRGRALPITGGISHQTISGFLATGSAGGSTTRSIHDVVRRITFVDGKGDVHTLVPGDVDFPAVLVSFGLFGIVCEVELATIPAFGIRGLRSVQKVEDADVDLFHDPSPSGRLPLRELLVSRPVSRLLWWPQPGVERVEIWEARCDAPPPPDAARIPQALGAVGPVAQILARALYAIYFEGVAPTAGEDVDATRLRRALELASAPLRMSWLAADLVRDVVAHDSRTRIDGADGRALLEALFAVATGGPLFPAGPLDPRGAPAPATALDTIRELVRALHGRTVAERLVALAIRLFVALSPRAATPWHDDHGTLRRYTAQHFYDTWADGLPMDDPVHDRLLPVQFTELWIPIDRTAAAMRALDALFRARGLAATGTFTIEVYAAKRSPAWLSAAHDGDVVRIDPFRYDDGDAVGRARFFDQFFDALEPFEPRFHWAKGLSDPWSRTGVDYRRRLYEPRLGAFLALRDSYDPDDVFLTRYWAEHLGVVPSVAPRVADRPGGLLDDLATIAGALASPEPAE